MFKRWQAAYAAAGSSSSVSGSGLSGLASRKHRFWFGLVALFALALPYAALLVVTARAIVNPPSAPLAVPELTVPVGPFTVIQVP